MRSQSTGAKDGYGCLIKFHPADGNPKARILGVRCNPTKKKEEKEKKRERDFCKEGKHLLAKMGEKAPVIEKKSFSAEIAWCIIFLFFFCLWNNVALEFIIR